MIADRWVWARRSTRWDPCPQTQPLVRLRVVQVAPGFVEMHHEAGHKTCEPYEIACETVAPDAARPDYPDTPDEKRGDYLRDLAKDCGL